VETREGTKSIFRGDATIEQPGNQLVVAADIYTILSVTPIELVLDNQDNFIHTFQKKDMFWRETFGQKKIIKEEFTEPINFKMKDLKNNWFIYKKTAKPGQISSSTELIQALNIKEIIDESKANGELTSYTSTNTETLPCTIIRTGKSILVQTQKKQWTFEVYKIDEKEFVFGIADGLLYFGKPL
jgi:hypothetical protein